MSDGLGGGRHLARVADVFYRMKFLSEAGDILGPARSPEGRAHRPGQRALYLSASPEGTILGSKRYFRPGDPPRAIFPLRVEAGRILDLRDAAACAYFGIDPAPRTVDWQDWRARGEPSPTWTISDRVRELGLSGMLYASRTVNAETHLTLFVWNAPGGAMVSPAGAAMRWSPAP